MNVVRYIIFVFFLLYSFVSAGQSKIDSLQKCLQSQQEDTNKVNTLIQLGYVLTDGTEYDHAIKYTNQARDLSGKLNFKAGQARAYEAVAWINQIRGDYSEAKSNYFRGIKVYKELGAKAKVAYLISRLANSYYTEGDYPEAIRTSYEALKIYEGLKDKPGTAYTYLLLGGLYYADKNYSASLKNFHSGLKLYEELTDTMGVAYSKLEIGKVDVQQGNFIEAHKKFEEALKVFERNKNETWIAETHISLGELFEGLGDKNKIDSKNNYSEALKNYIQNLSYYETINDRGALTTIYHLVGKIHFKLGNLHLAKTYLEKALQLGKEIGSKGDLQDIYKSLSRLDSLQKNYQRALEHYKMHILYRDSVSNEVTKRKLVQASMQYEFDKKEAIAKTEQQKNDEVARRTRNLQYFVIGAVLLIAVFLFVYGRQKQKAKTKIEKAYAELKATQQQLIQSEKMASLGELTAGIAHEIQNPLNFVNNFSEVNTDLIEELRMKNEKLKIEDGEVKELLNDIKDNSEKINLHGKRADAIVKGMLQHSRTSTGKKEASDINKLAEEYLRLAYHGLRAKDKSFNVETETDFDSSVGKINIIPQDIGRVFLNLINNAFYAVHERQKEEGDAYKPIVLISTRKIDGKIEIRLSDNGNGMPDSIKEKIFQPFFTTKPTGQGTGLGLSLAYDIIKAHGGEIKVESKEGDVTTFIIQLPNYSS